MENSNSKTGKVVGSMTYFNGYEVISVYRMQTKNKTIIVEETIPSNNLSK